MLLPRGAHRTVRHPFPSPNQEAQSRPDPTLEALHPFSCPPTGADERRRTGPPSRAVRRQDATQAATWVKSWIRSVAETAGGLAQRTMGRKSMFATFEMLLRMISDDVASLQAGRRRLRGQCSDLPRARIIPGRPAGPAPEARGPLLRSRDSPPGRAETRIALFAPSGLRASRSSSPRVYQTANNFFWLMIKGKSPQRRARPVPRPRSVWLMAGRAQCCLPAKGD